jgi:hypothetical protein
MTVKDDWTSFLFSRLRFLEDRKDVFFRYYNLFLAFLKLRQRFILPTLFNIEMHFLKSEIINKQDSSFYNNKGLCCCSGDRRANV